jgi:energy-coupling factor transporter ATP-binding protein EcfA2
MLKLRRLRVEKFRSLARNAELTFSDGINVLLGQNGTGKTTLLELISMVVRSDFSSLAKEEFAIEYEFAVPEGESIIVKVRNERMSPSGAHAQIELRTREVFRPSAQVLGGSDLRLLLQYSTERGTTPGWPEPHSSSTDPSVLDPGFVVFFLSPVVGFGDRFFIPLLQVGAAYRLDESLDLFRSITEKSEFLGEVIATDNGWLRSPFGRPLLPDELVDKLSQRHEPKKADYSFTQADLSFLAVLQETMAFSASELRIDVVEHRQYGDPQLGNLVFRFWWPDETFVTHERLSYGQKRLVMFFYYLACNPSIVVADELVNGLHHRWITASVEAIGQRQAFLTSQNPLLLDYIPITSVADAQRSFVICRGEPHEGKPGWLWDNMTEDDARELFSAHEVGVEHVSEILQSRGLW